MSAAYINIVIPPLGQPLTYEVPAELQTTLVLGARTTVPLGRRSAEGYVLDDPCSTKPSFAVKPLPPTAPITLCFNRDQLALFRWVSEYYAEPLSSVIDTAVPPFATPQEQRVIELLSEPTKPTRGQIQQLVLAALKRAGGTMQHRALMLEVPQAAPTLKKLIDAGHVRSSKSTVATARFKDKCAPDWAPRSIELYADQQRAVETLSAQISARSFVPTLLHGVTGSGKTEVYLECCRHALEQGLGVLVLVPEIALTPQLIDRFRARLGDNMGILHSGLPARVRWESWQSLLAGSTQIAIGARSGIFAPVTNLGLIIVDEEHDHSYKQSDSIRYHARDLALVRGQQAQCPVILGSATPSLETFNHAESKRYNYISLPSRQRAAAPVQVELVDLNKIKPSEMPSRNVSPELHAALGDVLERREQAFVLYNRRGFASYMQCEQCSSVVSCPNCSVTMTYHQKKHLLLCHYCSLSCVVPSQCTACHTSGEKPPLVLRGAGTERVIEEIQALFPQARVERLDRDAVADHESYRGILDRIRSGATDILVGTQMLAKGHDVPNVTLVGIADSDVGLHLPDFRASERVFQILTQAAGRAGRGDKPGRVILQTRMPRHHALTTTLDQDYLTFARTELNVRKELHYPPFSRLLRVTASSTDAERPLPLLQRVATRAQELREAWSLRLAVLGPAPAPLERLKSLWRYHLLIKAARASDLNRVLRTLRSELPKNPHIRVSFDLDPYDMM